MAPEKVTCQHVWRTARYRLKRGGWKNSTFGGQIDRDYKRLMCRQCWITCDVPKDVKKE